MVTSWTARVAGVLTTAALLLGGCAAQSGPLTKLVRVDPSRARAAATTIVPVNPYGASGPAAGLTISLTTSGNCQSSYQDAANRNAFRCFIDELAPDGSNIEDPCFAPPSGATDGSLLCLNSPDAHAAVKIIPGAPPEPSATANADPWYVQLGDGSLCGLTGGATDELDGMRLNYSCPDGSSLYGDPVRTTPLWTIQRQDPGATALHQAQIVRAWQ